MQPRRHEDHEEKHEEGFLAIPRFVIFVRFVVAFWLLY
jgi:hypothetical protein